ncbi:MAG: iron-regulated protein [Bacteroidetes bacterium]|nr:MAG: iron-regulated protein [Bacteroidota bacterium]
MKLSALLFILVISLQSFSQDKPAYKVFTGEGKKADYEDLLKEVTKADVVFFGELHDNPVAHWLELEVTKSLFAEKGKNLILAAEMFEKDNQLLIDEYFAGIIKESSFESEIRLWKNYGTDYKPLIAFAKQNELKFVASNIPRRYASVVANGGFEALEKLSPEALKYIAPLPVEYDSTLACYKDMLSMESSIGGTMEKKVSPNLPKAQAIKDATMARSILDNWKKGQMVIHYNGSYHSDRYMGIIWYLKKYDTSIKVATITTVLQDDIYKMDDENKNQADFVIVIPSSMTRTYK